MQLFKYTLKRRKLLESKYSEKEKKLLPEIIHKKSWKLMALRSLSKVAKQLTVLSFKVKCSTEMAT